MLEKEAINNAFYNELGQKWYTATDHAIALLRAENRARTPWIIETIHQHFTQTNTQILDVACGAGFLSNPLAQAGFKVTAVDLSEDSLKVAALMDQTQSINYLKADAYALPFLDHSFDVVCSMDFLEHVDNPQKVISEIARVLKPNGLFFFHTFNRNPISWLVILKSVEWFIKNSPKNLHLFKLFIKPSELRGMCTRAGLNVVKMRGLTPVISPALLHMLLKKEVRNDFTFKFTTSLMNSYCGYAIK